MSAHPAGGMFGPGKSAVWASAIEAAGATVRRVSPAELAADNFYGLDYHFNVFKKNADWIAEAKKLKLTINVWTVNDKETLEEMLKNEVDFITTNEPELLLSMLK